MKKLVEALAKALVDEPDAVHVEEVMGDNTCVLKLAVAKNDIGKVIGKKGSNANAIRTLLDAASGKQNQRCVLEIIE
jgi:predicted RNA-binding protein YlqC (UPF0109 family)